MNVLQVHWHRYPDQAPLTVGRLAFKTGQALFEYDPDFTQMGISISPLQLPLQANLQAAERAPFDGLHGVFADSLPDGWGLLLMDRLFRQHNIDISTITPLDRLAYIGSRAMGALSYRPDTGEDFVKASSALSLATLAEESLRIYQGSAEDVLPELAIAGGSPGGARPKVAIGLGDTNIIAGTDDLPEGHSHWIVKFPTGTTEHAKYEGTIEYLYSILARKAGINMPETRLLPAENSPGYFAIKRFDRGVNNQRVHMHSLAGMINADFRLPDCDYETLIKASSSITKRHGDTCEAFRRMVFNIFSGNRDDHTKNFSYLMDAQGVWRFSPAYDITFSSGINGEHSMSVNGLGKGITLDAILAMADLVPLSRKKAMGIIAKVMDSLSGWKALAKEYDIPLDVSGDISAYISAAYRRTTYLPIR